MPPSRQEKLFHRILKSARKVPILSDVLRWGRKCALPLVERTAVEIVRKAIPSSTTWGFPKGVYVAPAPSPSADCRDGRTVLEDQGAPRIPKNSMMLKCHRRQHEQQPWKVYWSRCKNAKLVGPSLAQIDAGKLLCVDSVYGLNFYRDDPSYNFFVRGKPIRLEGRWTSIVSRWSSVDRPQPYGHWILDALPRLAVLQEFPQDTGILVPPFRTRYQEESMKLLGLLDRCRWTNEQHLLVEDYYFSSPVSMVVSYSPYSVDFLRSAFLPFSAPSNIAPKRVFVTRNTQLRGIANRAEVLDFFAAAGWVICDTAEMSFVEQVTLFAQVAAICILHGSAVQNTVWCSQGAHVVELFADRYLAGDGEWIAQCTRADYSFLIFPCDSDLNIQVDVAELRRHLRSLKLI